jgi:hypothetical protein
VAFGSLGSGGWWTTRGDERDGLRAVEHGAAVRLREVLCGSSERYGNERRAPNLVKKHKPKEATGLIAVATPR